MVQIFTFTCTYRVKAFIDNGWDKKIVDPDPSKKHTQAQQAAVTGTDSSHSDLQSVAQSRG